MSPRPDVGRVGRALGLAGLCLVAAACSSHPSSGADAGAPSGKKLVIQQLDGSPVPAVLGYGASLVVEVRDATTGEVEFNPMWKAAGACALAGEGVSTRVEAIGFGTCDVTAWAQGSAAGATLTIVAVTDLAVQGDSTPFAIGETRTFTAVPVGPAPETAQVAVLWKQAASGQVFDLAADGATVRVTARAVGAAALTAAAGEAAKTTMLHVAPSSIQITGMAQSSRPGATVAIDATAFGPGGKACPVVDATDMIIRSTCVGGAASGMVQSSGHVSFEVRLVADCPEVTVADGDVVSNALSFQVDKVASVEIVGLPAPVVVGATVTFRAQVRDMFGQPFDNNGSLIATFVDANGVYAFMPTGTFDARARVAKTGTAQITATVQGITSAPVLSGAIPGGVLVTSASPNTIAVGGKTSVTVNLQSVDGMAVADTAVGPLAVVADDRTKISFDKGTANGTNFTFVGTGLAPTADGGVKVRATWSDGQITLVSDAVAIGVTAP